MLSSFGGALQMRWRATTNTSHTKRLIHPYIVKCTAVRSKRVGPLYVRTTLWHENDREVEITYYTTTSQRCNGTGKTVWGNDLGPLDALQRHWGFLRTVYKAKRASSVRSAFLWESLGARVGWAGLAPGGDGRVSAAFARSSRNLSNSERNKLILKVMYNWGGKLIKQYTFS